MASPGPMFDQRQSPLPAKPPASISIIQHWSTKQWPSLGVTARDSGRRLHRPMAPGPFGVGESRPRARSGEDVGGWVVDWMSERKVGAGKRGEWLEQRQWKRVQLMKHGLLEERVEGESLKIERFEVRWLISCWGQEEMLRRNLPPTPALYSFRRVTRDLVLCATSHKLGRITQCLMT